jgi:hypothetical protein
MNSLHRVPGLSVVYGRNTLRDRARSKCQFHKAHARRTTKGSLDMATGATQTRGRETMLVAMVTGPFHLSSRGITRDLLQVSSQLFLKGRGKDCTGSKGPLCTLRLFTLIVFRMTLSFP